MLIASACSDNKGAPKTTDTPSDEPATQTPWFADQVNESGVDFIHQSGQSGKFYIPEIVAGGAALFDMDADGDLDLYLIQSGDVTNATIENPPNQLYENDGNGKFTNVTTESGADDRGYGIGAANLAAAGSDFIIGADGILTMEFWESYNDHVGAADAKYTGGSVTIEYNEIPAPGALALLGLAGIAGTRRRRA